VNTNTGTKRLTRRTGEGFQSAKEKVPLLEHRPKGRVWRNSANRKEVASYISPAIDRCMHGHGRNARVGSGGPDRRTGNRRQVPLRKAAFRAMLLFSISLYLTDSDNTLWAKQPTIDRQTVSIVQVMNSKSRFARDTILLQKTQNWRKKRAVSTGS